MGAEVGDEVVVGSSNPAEPGRIGIIVSLDQSADPDEGETPAHGEAPGPDVAADRGDGSPRYVIHWLVGDYDSRILPGPGLRIKLQHKAGRPGRLEGRR